MSDAEITELLETSEPGIYEVVTATGSFYRVTLDPDAPTSIARVRDHNRGDELYGGEEPITCSAFAFRVGFRGQYAFHKPEEDQPDDFEEIGVLYAGTSRETSTVTEIRRVR